MPHYRVEYDGRGRVANRDARAVYVRLWRDDEYLGLYQGVVSGPDLAVAGRLGKVDGAFWSTLAHFLARWLQDEVQAGNEPDSWSETITTYLFGEADVSRVLRESRAAVVPVDEGTVLVEFDS